MVGGQINPTRMELRKLKKKLATARHGHKLLKDKRDELMRQFLELIREGKLLRDTIEREMIKSNEAFIMASGLMGKEAIKSALLAPVEEIHIDVVSHNVMSVEVPQLTPVFKKGRQESIYCYGAAFTVSELDEAIESVYDMVPNLLRLAECEKACECMAHEIEKTRRRVNALEHVMIPEMQRQITYIMMKLDENERSNQIRLMKVKDHMLEQAHQYREKGQS